MIRARWWTMVGWWLAAAPIAPAQRIADLTVQEGAVPVRLVGYGLVMGLDGTGDRSFGTNSGAVMTVRSTVNLLRRFGIEVPPERLRLRNVAAVVVTAELSPWLRPGARFEVQVSALGDATSLRGGVLWMSPLMTDPAAEPMATAQGPLLLTEDLGRGASWTVRRGNSARIPEGGVLEWEIPRPATGEPGLVLLRPDFGTADRIARAVEAAYGEGTAEVVDPGLIRLKPPGSEADNPVRFLAAVDTLPVAGSMPAAIVIDARTGAVVTGGDSRIGPATVTVRGITVRIGGEPGAAGTGLVALQEAASAQDVAAGLHAAGARAEEVAAVFEALGAAGALRARVMVR